MHIFAAPSHCPIEYMFPTSINNGTLQPIIKQLWAIAMWFFYFTFYTFNRTRICSFTHMWSACTLFLYWLLVSKLGQLCNGCSPVYHQTVVSHSYVGTFHFNFYTPNRTRICSFTHLCSACTLLLYWLPVSTVSQSTWRRRTQREHTVQWCDCHACFLACLLLTMAIFDKFCPKITIAFMTLAAITLFKFQKF